jgi:hypothetical protein
MLIILFTKKRYFYRYFLVGPGGDAQQNQILTPENFIRKSSNSLTHSANQLLKPIYYLRNKTLNFIKLSSLLRVLKINSI